MNKKWRDYPFNTKYEVSQCGSVRNKNTGKLCNGALREGYKIIHLCSPNINTSFHRMVAMTWLPVPEGKERLMENYKEYDVHHKDTIKTNNHMMNLELIKKRDHALREIKENPQRAFQSREGHIKFKGKIGKFNLDGILVDILVGGTDITEKEKDLRGGNVYAVINGKKQQYKNHVYRRFKEGEELVIGQKYDIFEIKGKYYQSLLEFLS
jgi:hypothetical protein